MPVVRVWFTISHTERTAAADRGEDLRSHFGNGSAGRGKRMGRMRERENRGSEAGKKRKMMIPRRGGGEGADLFSFALVGESAAAGVVMV